ncbi:MAG TPA: hypothetical protein DDW41_04280 [Candidatus Andersenbacteria bacterium]|nr:hypothetical protein [Candidatus Andersenbacteria bacterium]
MRERLIKDQPDSYENFLSFMSSHLPEEHRHNFRGYLEKNGIREPQFNFLRSQILEHDIQPEETAAFLDAYATSLNDASSPALQQFLNRRLSHKEPAIPKHTDTPTPTAV